MSEELKDFSYTVGIFDIICRTIRRAVKEGAQKEGAYGIGVYTDRYCEQELMTHPIKSLEERMQIAKCFDGVDFVFSIDSRDSESIRNVAQEAYDKYVIEQKKEENPKKYKVGFLIGSFDVFHTGHLENIKSAMELCDKLVAVVKTDERIQKKKNKNPRQSTAERAAVLSSLKLIEKVIYYDVDATREDVLNDILELDICKDVELKNIVAVFGSDLEEKESAYIDTCWKDINVVFTYRDSEKMKTVSSTNYQKKCDRQGGINVLEEKEKQHIQNR